MNLVNKNSGFAGHLAGQNVPQKENAVKQSALRDNLKDKVSLKLKL